MRNVVRFATRALMFACLASLGAASTSAGAEIKGVAQLCPGQKICAWFQANVALPKGWTQDVEASAQNHVTLLEPDKDDLGDEDALIYIQTSPENGPETLDEIIQSNLGTWRKSDPKATFVSEDSVRARGFKLYLFRNPDRPKQAYERIAYGFTKGSDGKRYFLTIVDTGASREIIDKADIAFRYVLNQF